MKDIGVLEDIGLSKGQIKVYVALLELGETTSGPLIRKSGLQNSVVYNALNQLMEKGLVGYVLKGKRKLFSAHNPQNLLDYVDDKRQKLEKVVPQLIAKQTLVQEKQEAQVFTGWKGLYNAFNFILTVLPTGSEYIGFAGGFEEQFSVEAKRFFREFQKKRVKLKYNVKLIVNEEARKQVEEYEYYRKFGTPIYRFVPGIAPQGVIIFGDYILQIGFEEEPVAVVIHSSAISDSYRKFFYRMWEYARS